MRHLKALKNIKEKLDDTIPWDISVMSLLDSLHQAAVLSMEKNEETKKPITERKNRKAEAQNDYRLKVKNGNISNLNYHINVKTCLAIS